jgi:hypothetical protein
MAVRCPSFFATVSQCALAAVTAVCCFVEPIWAVPSTTTVVAISGDPTPDGSGVFGFFFESRINDLGQVAFQARITGADSQGVFRGDGASLVQIIRTGQIADDGNGSFSSLILPAALNNAGEVALGTFLANTVGGATDNQMIVRGDGVTVDAIARKGETSPDGNGTFGFLTSGLSLNQSDQVAFRGKFIDTDGGMNDDDLIIRGDGSVLTQIVREGQAAPDGNGIVSLAVSVPGLNDAGEVAFRASLAATTGGLADNEAIYRGDGSSLVEIVRKGQSPPDGIGELTSFHTGSNSLNDAGEVAFLSTVTDVVGPSAHTRLFRSDGKSLVQLVSTADAAPDGNGSFSDFPLFTASTLNNTGQFAFRANLSGTAGGLSDNLGIFRSDGTSLVQIARKGQAAPDGNGLLSTFVEPTMNEAGQVAFLANLTATNGGGGDNQGIFFYDDSIGIVEIARTGDTFQGGTISSLNAVVAFGRGGGMAQAVDLSDRGTPRIAYQFLLTDGRSGIAVWALVPEPSSLLLVSVAAVVMATIVNLTGRRNSQS